MYETKRRVTRATAIMLALGGGEALSAQTTAPTLRGQEATGQGPQNEALQQAAPSTADQANAAIDPSRDGGTAAAGNNLSDIVVTGSRIVRNGYQAPTPVTVVTSQQLVQAAPTNIPDGLKQLPQIQGSTSDTRSSTNANRPDNGNYLNLRGVGPVRGLILLDGRRVPPTSFQGSVDVNTLPQALVSRVDVVTAGASAVYGADAVSGVINFVLDTNYTGLKGSVQQGISTYADDPSWRVSLAGGFDLAEGLHVVASAEHFQRQGIRRRSDRGYLIDPNYGLTGTGTATNPFILVPNIKTVSRAYGGIVTTGPFLGNASLGAQFAPGGTLVPFVFGTPTGVSNLRIGGDGYDNNPNASLTGLLNTEQFFANIHYNVTPDIKLFVQASYASSHNYYTNNWDFHTISVYEDNPYLNLTSAQQAALAATRPASGAASFNISRISRDLDVNHTATDNRSLNATGGLQGKVFGDYNFELYYTHGHSELETHSPQAFNQRFYAAADAVDEGQFRTGVRNGRVVCRVTLVNPTLLPGCQPVNFLGEMTPQQAGAARAYIDGDSNYLTKNTLDEVAGNIGGSPFSTWAGKVSFNVGANYRRQSLTQTSSGNPRQTVDYTGIRGVPAGTTPFFFTNVGIASGRYSVWEVNGEAVVPLAHDITLLQDLELNGAYRYAHYSTSGGVSTWKAGLNWQPFDGLRFRVTRSRDIRAPTLYDLFAGQQVNPEGYTDTLLGNRNYVILSQTKGNQNLRPEKGDTFSAGAIIQPKFLSGFSASIDYFRLKITDAITNISTNTVRDVCFVSGGTSSLCALQPRALGSFTSTDPANIITTSILDPINLASLTTEGVDVDLTYSFSLGAEAGRVTLRSYASYVPHYRVNDGVGGRVRDLVDTVGGGVDAPDVVRIRGLASISYSNKGLDTFLQARYIHKTKRDTQQNTQRYYVDNVTPAQVYFDMTISYAIPAYDGKVSPFLSINNLLNKKVPINSNAFAQGSVYDIRGRYFNLGARMAF